jgi:hypothetical protein
MMVSTKNPFERVIRMTAPAALLPWCENPRYMFAINDWPPFTGHSRTSATGPQESMWAAQKVHCVVILMLATP